MVLEEEEDDEFVFCVEFEFVIGVVKELLEFDLFGFRLLVPVVPRFGMGMGVNKLYDDERIEVEDVTVDFDFDLDDAKADCDWVCDDLVSNGEKDGCNCNCSKLLLVLLHEVLPLLVLSFECDLK